jgi:steroid delta-isomerase-like uncharacterized protein
VDTSNPNKAIVRQWVDEVLNQDNFARVDELAAPEYGAAYRQRREQQRATFADFRHSIEDIMGEDDKVMICWESSAVHTGNWRGVPANVKPVTWRGISIYYINDGKIVDEITSWNRLDMYQQLVGLPEWFQH